MRALSGFGPPFHFGCQTRRLQSFSVWGTDSCPCTDSSSLSDVSRGGCSTGPSKSKVRRREECLKEVEPQARDAGASATSLVVKVAFSCARSYGGFRELSAEAAVATTERHWQKAGQLSLCTEIYFLTILSQSLRVDHCHLQTIPKGGTLLRPFHPCKKERRVQSSEKDCDAHVWRTLGDGSC